MYLEEKVQEKKKLCSWKIYAFLVKKENKLYSLSLEGIIFSGVYNLLWLKFYPSLR